MSIAVSDESGDTGLFSDKGTRSYISGIALIRNEKDLIKLNNIARKYSRPYLNSPLRKWSELKGSVKNNPEILYHFYSKVLDEIYEENLFLVFSFFFLDKKTIEDFNLSMDSFLNIKYKFSKNI